MNLNSGVSIVKRTLVLTLAGLAFAVPLYAYNVYYGNLHAHCSYSDGIGTPQQAFEYARDSAMVDIQALTDHTHLLTSGEYSNLRAYAASYTQDGVFVAIAGQEHGSLSTSRTGSFGHMNFYESTSLIPQYDNGGDDYRYNLAGTYSWLISHTDAINGEPLFAVFNHPYYSGGTGADAQFHHFAYSVSGDAAMALTEVRNGQRGDNYETEYFEALAKGWHVGVTANQDNHNGMWGDQPNPNSGNDIYLTGVLADTLTKEAVLHALKARRTFAVEVNPKSDRMGLLYQCDGHWMGEMFETAADTIHFDITIWAGNNFVSVELLRNGTQIDYTSPGSNYAEWHPEDEPPFGESYYLVRAQQTDGDYLWSSPIWVVSTSESWDAISEVNEDDVNGEPVLLGQQVTIKGITTVATGTFSTANNDVFVQDATGGVNVVKIGSQTPSLSLGDSVTVTGIVDDYFGLTRISSPTITVEAMGLDVPAPLLITTGDINTNGEVYEGLLVKVEGAEATGGTWPIQGQDGTLTIDDGSGGCTMFIDKDTDIDGSDTPAGQVDIVGIVAQYDPSFPYHSGYRLVPRSTGDITGQAGIGEVSGGPGLIARLLPNPTRGNLSIMFGRDGAGQTKRITFYDVAGREVGSTSAGRGVAVLSWQAVDTQGRELPPGIYFVEVRTDAQVEKAKVVLVR
jgi:hypothetical protein